MFVERIMFVLLLLVFVNILLVYYDLKTLYNGSMKSHVQFVIMFKFVLCFDLLFGFR